MYLKTTLFASREPTEEELCAAASLVQERQETLYTVYGNKEETLDPFSSEDTGEDQSRIIEDLKPFKILDVKRKEHLYAWMEPQDFAVLSTGEVNDRLSLWLQRNFKADEPVFKADSGGPEGFF